MTPERAPISVFFEGPSCSGKTRLLKTIMDSDTAIIFKDWPADLKNPSLAFFLERDEDKLIRAKNSLKNLRLIDRGYLSTLTFYSVLEEQEGISSEPVLKWFINEMGNKLYRPDHYIFLDVSAEISVQRANKGGWTVADNNMWLRFPDRINFWYGRLFTVFEPKTSTYRVDGNRKPEVVSEEVNDILSDLRKTFQP